MQPPAASPPPAEPTPDHLATATMSDGRIVLCNEWRLDGNDAQNALLEAAHQEPAGDNSIRFREPCTARFSDRTAWGRCDHGSNTMYVYDFATVYNSDVTAMGCMRGGGEWTAEPRNTPAWERAKIDAEQLRLEAELDRPNRRR